MKTEFKLMLLSNALFFSLYLLWNWAEYSFLPTVYNTGFIQHFPLYIQISGSTKNGYGLISAYDWNFGLVILLIAIIADLYLAFRLQKKPNT